MTEEIDGSKRVTLPRTDAVLSELKALRQREGISPERVQRYAPAIQSLPVVIDEREQRRFSEGDEHVAAYNVIGCAVENLVRDPTKRVILRHTLNYEGNHFDLDSRRGAAAAELFKSVSACEPIEARAFIDLAALLVDAMETPCRTRRRTVTDQEVLEAFQNYRNLSDLKQALSVFAREKDPAVQEAIARVVRKMLPRGYSSTGGQSTVHGMADAGVLGELLKEAFDVHYQKLWDTLKGRWNGTWILPPTTMRRLFSLPPSGAGPVMAAVAAEAQRFEWPWHGQASPQPELWDAVLQSPTLDFYTTRAATIHLLSRAMQMAEAGDQWQGAAENERRPAVDGD